MVCAMALQRPVDLDDCLALDAGDPLATVRDRFCLPDGITYLDGNSLGALSHPARRRLLDVADDGWGRRLIEGWSEGGWLEAPARVGDRIGALVGAAPGQVVVSDSTTLNVFKLASAAFLLRPQRGAVVIPGDDFPTDRYVLAGLGAREVRTPERGALAAAVDGDVAVVVLSHVDYRTAELADMAAVTSLAHDAGALVLWDLCHSAGALPVALDACEVDLAVGCTYKFLNGGPGAPAFLYAARRHHDRLRSPIQGWFGHGDQFGFGERYEPAPGVARFLTGTTGMLGLAALDGALEVWHGVDMAAVRAKSMALGDVLIGLVDDRCARLGITVASPRDAARRGSHVALRHPRAGVLADRLAAGGVVTDFRPPDVIRCGLTPLYTRFVDLWRAVEVLRDELGGGR
jgi:kynureninase